MILVIFFVFSSMCGFISIYDLYKERGYFNVLQLIIFLCSVFLLILAWFDFIHLAEVT
jgi:hypothetical protein